jgi:hypothetical protein
MNAIIRNIIENIKENKGAPIRCQIPGKISSHPLNNRKNLFPGISYPVIPVHRLIRRKAFHESHFLHRLDGPAHCGSCDTRVFAGSGRCSAVHNLPSDPPTSRNTYPCFPGRSNIAKRDLPDSRRRTTLDSGTDSAFFRNVPSRKMGGEGIGVQPGILRAPLHYGEYREIKRGPIPPPRRQPRQHTKPSVPTQSVSLPGRSRPASLASPGRTATSRAWTGARARP